VLYSASEFLAGMKQQLGLCPAQVSQKTAAPQPQHQPAIPRRAAPPVPTASTGRPPSPGYPNLTVCDREGNANFINGNYTFIVGSVEKYGTAVFERTERIPPGFGTASGQACFIHYHTGNRAWVITLTINSPSVIAYAAGDGRLQTLLSLHGHWNVTESSGYVADPRMRIIDPAASLIWK